MNLTKKQYNIFFLLLVTFILLIGIFKWIDYLVKNNYVVENSVVENSVVENFDQYSSLRDTGSPTTSHTVNLPLTTTYSCNNFCGPGARCAKTGHQCTSDIDCPGCQPYVPPLKKSNSNIPGDNDAGKLTFGATPRYSTLTTDIGTQARLFTPHKFSKPAIPNFGINSWRASFNQDEKEFNERYKPPHLQNMPNYDKRYSLSGEFIDDGPIASNAYLS